jgi:hypothetical protein
MIDYDKANNAYASGYLTQIPWGYATPSIGTLAPIYNASIYGLQVPGVTSVSLNMTVPSGGNLTAARAILNEHCFSNGLTGVNERWTVKEATGVSNTSAYVLGVSPLYNATTGAQAVLGAAEVTNPFNIVCMTGWNDVDGETQSVAEAMTAFGIPTAFRTEAFWSPIMDDSLNGNYSMLGYGQGGQTPLGVSAVQVMQSFVGTKNQWGANPMGWDILGAPYNQFVDLYKLFETTDPVVNSTGYLDVGSKMQLILAQTLPTIPMFANGYWYAYNDAVWQGWDSASVPFQQCVAQYETTNEALKCRQVLNLNLVVPINHNLPPASIPGFPVFFLLLAAIGPVAVILARARKNAISQ